MRLIHLPAYYGPYAGSFVPMLRSILLAGREAGWDSEAVLPAAVEGREWLAELERDDIPYRFLDTTTRRSLRDHITALLAERPEPTILHTHFTQFDLAAAAAAHKARKLVFWHIHSRAEPALTIRLRNLIKYTALARRVEKILCVSPDMARAVERRGGSRRKVLYWPNAIDLERFPLVGPAERVKAREQLGLPKDATVLVHFGWDWWRKGGDLYLRAVERLAEDGPRDLVAVTAGGAERAEALSSELGLDGCVRILPPSGEVQSYYAAADVFVTPSRAEGMPFAMAEALASGLPVVASDIPGQAAIGAEMESCILVPAEPGALAEGIRETLARPPAARQAAGLAARELIAENMSLTAWAGRLMGLYRAELESRAWSGPAPAP